jgi:hypothetical protein
MFFGSITGTFKGIRAELKGPDRQSGASWKHLLMVSGYRFFGRSILCRRPQLIHRKSISADPVAKKAREAASSLIADPLTNLRMTQPGDVPA